MNKKELEFAVFCIENIAERLKLGGDEVYNLIAVNSDVLKDYIVPNYEPLHTQGKEYIISDVVEYMTIKEVI